jgi:hypothetical protein
MAIVQFHLDAFVELSNQDEYVWRGADEVAWAKHICPNRNFPNLSSSPRCREQLKSFCRKGTVTPEECFIACMAWGRSNIRNARLAWSDRERWKPVLERIRSGALDRNEAYDKLNIGIPGLGPAFFTKLIFFLMPKGKTPGYIMDQWTAKSVDLLWEPSFLRFRGGYVSPSNSSFEYIKYCEKLEMLSRRVAGNSPEHIEIKLFSEGRGQGKWRRHVIQHWKHKAACRR